MATEPPRLQGLRILIVEDNLLAAMELEQILTECGCQPVGPAATVEQALRLAREEQLDGAVLDVNLRDQVVFPVAEELARRNVALIFATGYEDNYAFPPQLADRPRLRKPYAEQEFVRLLRATFGRGQAAATPPPETS
jgi:DNA-binding response OmpR family regulator